MMNQKSRRNTVQVRLNDDEFKMLNDVREQINCKNNSETLRAILQDENMVMLASRMMANGHPEVATELKKIAQRNHRSPLVFALMGVNNQEGQRHLRALGSRLSNIDDQLSSLNWLATNLTNNVNQISHWLNIVLVKDPENGHAWQHALNQMAELHSLTNEVKDAVQSVKRSLYQKERAKQIDNHPVERVS